jgi:nitrogen fixation/metabolism regulation signal transduction histidine kinase
VVYHLSGVNFDSEAEVREAVAYLSGYHRQGLYVFEGDLTLINHLPEDSESVVPMVIKARIDPNLKQGIFEDDALIISYENDARSGWTVAVAGKKKILARELIDAQKYSILVAIISLILSMQATILIAHHLSRPVRYLAEQCNQMSAGDLDTQLEMDRNDEIGILAHSFNQMIGRLQDNARKLLEAKQFNEDILRSLTTGVLVMDQEGSILNQNEAALRLMSPSLSEQGTDKTFVTLLQEQLDELLEKSHSIDQLYVLQAGLGDEKRYYATSAAPLINNTGDMTGAIFSFNDITERKRLEMRMERVNRMAYVGQLASGLAHEIRNPLAGMKTSIQVLKRRLVMSEEDRNNALFNNVIHEIDRMNKLVSELLDFAKPHLPDLKMINLVAVIERTLSLVAPAADDQLIKLAFSPQTDLVEIMADENQTEQILLNVITNAINASSAQDTINLRIKSLQREGGGRVHVVVEDEGRGIAASDLDKVFDPFFTTHATGTGLGLSVVQKLMTDMGGEIELISKEGVGTTVILKFPAA